MTDFTSTNHYTEMQVYYFLRYLMCCRLPRFAEFFSFSCDVLTPLMKFLPIFPTPLFTFAKKNAQVETATWFNFPSVERQKSLAKIMPCLHSIISPVFTAMTVCFSERERDYAIDWSRNFSACSRTRRSYSARFWLQTISTKTTAVIRGKI